LTKPSRFVRVPLELRFTRFRISPHQRISGSKPEGFKGWSGGFSSRQASTSCEAMVRSNRSHILEELFDPGRGSNLDKATLRVWNAWSKSREAECFHRDTDFFEVLTLMYDRYTNSPL